MRASNVALDSEGSRSSPLQRNGVSSKRSAQKVSDRVKDNEKTLPQQPKSKKKKSTAAVFVTVEEDELLSAEGEVRAKSGDSPQLRSAGVSSGKNGYSGRGGEKRSNNVFSGNEAEKMNRSVDSLMESTNSRSGERSLNASEFMRTPGTQPSYLYEKTIVDDLERLVLQQPHQSVGFRLRDHFLRIDSLLNNGIPGCVTLIMLLLSCFTYYTSQTIWCTMLFLVLQTGYSIIQLYVYWERVSEAETRTLCVMTEVVSRWRERIQLVSNMSHQTPEERRMVFLECLAVLPSTPFRFISVVERATSRLKHTLKCLAMKKCDRINDATLKVTRYMEPVTVCKLCDVMKIILQGSAIALRPLTDRQRPPRLPNQFLSTCNVPEAEEENDTTDESDREDESRNPGNGGDTVSVSNHMEYFVQRVFLLMWLVGMILAVTFGLVYSLFDGTAFGQVALLDPSVALIGLLPLNAFLMHRVLVLYANVYLHQLFDALVEKPIHTIDDDLPRFSLRETLSNAVKVVLRRRSERLPSHPLCFGRSMVEALGMASVVALLDAGGILTDMVTVPVVVLLMAAEPGSTGEDDDGKHSSRKGSISSEDEPGAGLNYTRPRYTTDVTFTSAADVSDSPTARDNGRANEIRRQVRRKQFQEQRFIELALMTSHKKEVAVQFAEQRELNENKKHMSPLCLCIIVQALAPQPGNLETWTETFRFCDRTPRWVRSLHWLPRAAGFDDDMVDNFRIIARVFMIDTDIRSGYHNSFPEQVCGFLVEDANNQLHVFSIGTPYMLLEKCCCLFWSGDDVGSLDKEARSETVFMGKHQWEDGRSLETVAAAHRLLPDRYRTYVDALPPPEHGEYHEFFFRNGVEITKNAPYKHRKRFNHRHAAPISKHASHNRRSPHKSPVLRCVNGSGPERARSRSMSSTQSAHSEPSRDGYPRLDDDSDAEGDESHSASDAYVSPGPKRRAHNGGRTGRSRLLSHAERSKLCRCRSCSPLVGTTSKSTATSSFHHTVGQQQRSHSLGSEPIDRAGTSRREQDLTQKAFIKRMMCEGHTFLGLVGVQDSVRSDVPNCLGELDDAGIRCMYFSPENERRTKSFGSRLGLETDWNSCISLKEEAVTLDSYSIRAQLPFGIKSIRKHILHVDPIPLQVSLFSHAHGVATRAMLSILQDNHEVVVTVGSLFNHGNVRSFVQSDFAVGVLPTRRGQTAAKEDALEHGPVIEPSNFKAIHSLNRDIPLYKNVTDLIGCSCSIRAPPTTSIVSIVTSLIRQARLRLSGISNCVEFIMHASVLVVLVNMLAIVCGTPLLISPTAAVFELNIIIPILSLACTYTAYSGIDPMKMMQSRHNFFVRFAIFRHSTIVFLVRYLPSAIALVALGITCGLMLCNENIVTLALRTTDTCMISTRGYIALTLNYWLMIHCWTHMSRHHRVSLNFSLRTMHGQQPMYLYQSYRLVIVSLCTTVLSILSVLIDGRMQSAIEDAFFPSVAHFIISLVFPIFIYACDIPIKRWRERRFINMQKFRKLSFETRLGMHSPRGDYEPDGLQYKGSTNGEDDNPRQSDVEEEVVGISPIVPEEDRTVGLPSSLPKKRRAPSPTLEHTAKYDPMESELYEMEDAGSGVADDTTLARSTETEQRSTAFTVPIADEPRSEHPKESSAFRAESPPASTCGDHGMEFSSKKPTQASTTRRHHVPLKQKLSEILFRFTTMQGGRLELNCVCCDHVGGNYATYHTNPVI